jgi:hypothetical protein
MKKCYDCAYFHECCGKMKGDLGTFTPPAYCQKNKKQEVKINDGS